MKHEVVIATLVDEDGFSVEQVATAVGADGAWLLAHIEAGLFPHAQLDQSEQWRCDSRALQRARRMRQLERDFAAVPELAALVADLLEERDQLRARIAHLEQPKPEY